MTFIGIFGHQRSNKRTFDGREEHGPGVVSRKDPFALNGAYFFEFTKKMWRYAALRGRTAGGRKGASDWVSRSSQRGLRNTAVASPQLESPRKNVTIVGSLSAGCDTPIVEGTHARKVRMEYAKRAKRRRAAAAAKKERGRRSHGRLGAIAYDPGQEILSRLFNLHCVEEGQALSAVRCHLASNDEQHQQTNELRMFQRWRV